MLKKLSLFSLVIILLSIYFRSGCKEGKIVETKSGFVKGVISVSRDGREFYEWLGIPYAQPPIEDLRFASPQPVSPWNGIIDANNYGSRCPQVDPFTLLVLGDEDCLTLNIHVPKIDNGEKLPVMVYIHGGAYNGMASFDYRPHYFMDEDVLLVTFNYRLGIFGFLSTGDKSIRGNMGLKDQTLALKWVKQNIGYFGGNPNQITIFGESAGGASVHYHLLSTKSRGLFHKAISLSGVASNPWSFEMTEVTKNRTEEFARKVNCPTNDSIEIVECLRRRHWSELMDKQVIEMANLHVAFPHKDGRLFHPTLEAIDDAEAFLTKPPLEIVEKGLALRIPWITGVTADEGLVSSACFYTRPETMEYYENHWEYNTLRALDYSSSSPNASLISNKIRDYYFPPTSHLTTSNSNTKQIQYTKMFSDLYFNFHMHYTASVQRKFSPVYLYHIGRRGGLSLNTLYLNLHRVNKKSLPMKLLTAVGIFLQVSFSKFVRGEPPIDLGVSHADDLPLMFWLPFVTKFAKDEDADLQFSKDFVKLWASFAKNETMFYRGMEFTPTKSNGPLKYLDLNDKPLIINEPFADRMEFLKSLGFCKSRS